MEFQLPSFYNAIEPLSNFDIDKMVTTLILLRHGDLSYTTAVRYVIMENLVPLQPPSDSLQEVVFHPQESVKELELVLRANHERIANDILFVDLVEARMLDNVSVPVRVGQPNRSVITVYNQNYQGPFFPNLPVVANDRDSISGIDIGVTRMLYYDLPLHCITVSNVPNEIM